MNVYFSDDYTEADFIVVNAGLHILFWTYARFVEEDEAGRYRALSHLCALNLETALANLPLHLPATSDHILALVSGVCHLHSVILSPANHRVGILCNGAIEAISVLDTDHEGIRAMPNTRLPPR
jgi:hypothetical protein